MALSVGDLYRSSLWFTMANQLCMNVIHWRINVNQTSNSVINAHLDSILDRMVLIANGNANIAHNSVNWYRTSITSVHAAAGGHARERNLNIDGAGSDELLPGFVGLPYYLSSGYTGRSRRGRFHAAGWIEADQDAGVLSTSGSTKADAFLSILETNLTTSITAGRPVVYSRKIAKDQNLGPFDWPNQVEGAPETPWAFITAVTRHDILGTVYSRKIGRGQ